MALLVCDTYTVAPHESVGSAGSGGARGGLNRPAGVEQQYSRKATYCWIFGKAGGAGVGGVGRGGGGGVCLMRFTKASWHSGRECEMCSWMIFMAARW